MKKTCNSTLLLFTLCCTVCSIFDANAQVGWKWGLGSIGGTESWLITPDLSSNVFSSGYIYSHDQDSVNFGTTTVYDSGNLQQLIVTKADSSGYFIWAIGTQHANAQPIGMATDATGNLYVLGFYYSNTCTIGSYTLTNAYTSTSPFAPYYDMYFLVKFSPDGVVVWAENIAPSTDFGSGAGNIGGIGLDSMGNIYISGQFSLSSVTIGATTLINTATTGNTDVFITKYTSFGTSLWAKNFGGTFNSDPVGIAVAKSGNFYIAGVGKNRHYLA